MPQLPSRRDLLEIAALSAAAVAIPKLATTQTSQDGDMTAIEKQLAKPLSPEAQKLLKDAVKAARDEAHDRLKTKLPENSEPCFTYIPSLRDVRNR